MSSVKIEPSFEQARRLNLGSVRLYAFDWGAPPPDGISSVLIEDQPISAIAIDSDSDVHEVLLSAGIGPKPTSAPKVTPAATAAAIVSVGQPYIGEIQTSWEIRQSEPTANPGYYIPYDKAFADRVDWPVQWARAALRLRLFLRPPPQLFTRRPTHFGPMLNRPVSTELAVIDAYPVGGRKNVRVSVKPLAESVNFLITGVTYSLEVPLSPVQTVVAPNSFTFRIETPNVGWIFVRAAGTDDTRTFVQVWAED
jgi:hypothetical protein